MTTHQQPDLTALQWRKSSHSGSGNNCVEVASMAAAVAVRDDLGEPFLVLAWRSDAQQGIAQRRRHGAKRHAGRGAGDDQRSIAPFRGRNAGAPPNVQ